MSSVKKSPKANGPVKKSGKPAKAVKRKANQIGSNQNGHPLTDEERQAKKIKLKKDLHKATSVDELNQLQAAEKLYHSNFFHLQIEELLKEVKIKEKHQAFIDKWLPELTEYISSIEPDAEKVVASDLPWLKNKQVVPPISGDTPWAPSKYFFQYLSPKSISPIGSIRTSTIIGSKPVVDVCIEIPNEFFQKSNHLNGVYHQKRALYLAYIALQLSKWDQVEESQFSYASDDPLRPILCVKPTGKYGKHITFHLHVVCAEECFKLERFTSDKSNVKQLLKSGGKKQKEADVLKTDVHTPTPHYNSSILRDLTTTCNQEFLNGWIEGNANIQSAIVLLKVWLRQRELDQGYGGFSGYILTAFVVHLMQKNRINLSMNSYQIIRQVWIAFGNTSWNEVGKSISLYESKFPTNQPPLSDFHKDFDVVFADSTGFYNICSNVSLDVYLKIQQESENALKVLNDEHVNSFRYLFVTKTPIYLQLDHILCLDSRVDFPGLLDKYGTDEERFSYSGYWYPHLSKIVLRILRIGLGQRVHVILPVHNAEARPWNVTSKPPKTVQKLQFGLVLNAEFAFDILDKGPQSNLPEAEDFRVFWGGKSELRRFQDGSITEACVWGALTSSMAEKRLVCKHIVTHLLNHHFAINTQQFTYAGAELDGAFTLHSAYKKYKGSETNAENLSIPVIKTFDELAKCLRSLDGLPLAITSILGKSPVFRYCELNPIIPVARFTHEDDSFCFNAYSINECVIQFENSGKWPNDLSAIRRVKAAFHLQIAKALRKNFNLKAKGNADSVDVIKDYFFYRFTIAVPREVSLLKKEVSQKGVTKYRDTIESLLLERETVLLPRLTVSLHSLYHQHSSFGATVQIAKRWLQSQLFDQYLWPDECTEMLIAYQYLYSKVNAPCQPQTGFFRFLHLLAFTNWNTDLFLLNFNDDMSTDAISKLELKFISEREQFPALCIATSTGEPDKHVIWSKKAPPVEVLARVSFLARHAVNLIEENILNGFEAKSLFEVSYEGYDVMIKLKKEHIRETFLDDMKGIKKSGFINVPFAYYNPVQSYLKELRSAYDHVALFFHNPNAGQNITVLWKPATQTSQEFRLTAVDGQKLGDDAQLEFDYQQIINDFQVIGNGLVEQITNHRSK